MRCKLVEKTKHRSPLRLALGKTFYSLQRYAQWHRFQIAPNKFPQKK